MNDNDPVTRPQPTASGWCSEHMEPFCPRHEQPTASAGDLAELLRDWRQEPCEHNGFLGPLRCSPCLRDRILASDWFADVRREERERVLGEVDALVLDLNIDPDYRVPKRVMGDRLRAVLKPFREARGGAR